MLFSPPPPVATRKNSSDEGASRDLPTLKLGMKMNSRNVFQQSNSTTPTVSTTAGVETPPYFRRSILDNNSSRKSTPANNNTPNNFEFGANASPSFGWESSGSARKETTPNEKIWNASPSPSAFTGMRRRHTNGSVQMNDIDANDGDSLFVPPPNASLVNMDSSFIEPLFDDVPPRKITPAIPSRTHTNIYPVSPATIETTRTLPNSFFSQPHQEDDASSSLLWVIVYGFPQHYECYESIVRRFESYGHVVARRPLPSSAKKWNPQQHNNWICFRYLSRLQTEKALCQDGSFHIVQGDGRVILGVRRLDDVMAERIGVDMDTNDDQEPLYGFAGGQQDDVMATPQKAVASPVDSTQLTEDDILINNGDVGWFRKKNDVCEKIMKWVFMW